MKHTKIKPSETTVDYRYQREMDIRRVEAMTRSYDPNLLGVPVVSRRSDGSMVRLDGQHRLAANIAAGAGDVPILMEVHDGLSLREEAELFLRLNGGRTAVGVIDKYKARIEAHEPVAIEIAAVLKKHGLKIGPNMSRGVVRAVQAVEAVHHKGNLDKTLAVLVAWLDGAPEAYDAEFIKGVSWFFVSFPDADPLHLATRLADIDPRAVASRLRRESQQALTSRSEAARLVFTEVYNRRTPKAKRISATNVATVGHA